MLFRFMRASLFLLVTVFVFSIYPAYSANQNISLELQNSNLSDTIRLLAKFLHVSVIVSPSVNGLATLSLHEAPPLYALDTLLVSHGLAKWRVGNIWLIAPREELIKRKQEEIKWQEVSELSTPLVTKIWQIKYAKVDDIALILQNEQSPLTSKRGQIRIDIRTNIIAIRDLPQRLEEARRLIARLDVPIKQISIEARLASVDHDFEQELGISFAVKPQLSDNSGQERPRSWAEEAGRYSLAVAKLADGSLLDVKLAALEKAGHAELISSPSLFTANQQPASIEAGEEVPYQEVSESGGTAVVFKKAVLGLKVTPQVLPGGKVLLQLQINQDRPSHKMIQGVPTISTRQIKTSVLVKNGQTLVLGGIYETNEESGQRRLPFISQVPIVGLLFKQQTSRANKRELLIFVTPNIIAQEI